MKNLLYLFLGIFAVIAISATTVNVMTVKPAIPKVVLVDGFEGNKEVIKFVRNGYEKGYQLKHIYTPNSSYYRYIVVMEKY